MGVRDRWMRRTISLSLSADAVLDGEWVKCVGQFVWDSLFRVVQCFISTPQWLHCSFTSRGIFNRLHISIHVDCGLFLWLNAVFCVNSPSMSIYLLNYYWSYYVFLWVNLTKTCQPLHPKIITKIKKTMHFVSLNNINMIWNK